MGGIIIGVLLVSLALAFAAHALLPLRVPHRVRDQRGLGAPPFEFPAGFLWGAACADHQVEHAQNDDWTAFENDARANRREELANPADPLSGPKPGHIKGVTDVPELWLKKKTDFDTRFLDDFDLAKQMGHQALRFSLSWARLFPHDKNTLAPAGLDFYARIVDALLERGIKPMATLHHFALPQWLQTPLDGKRGVERRDAPELFAQFTEHVARALGDRVAFWTTINEPMVYTVLGYMDGTFPPNERREEQQTRPVVNQLLLMHQAAYRVLKDDARRRGVDNQVGIAQHVRTFMPLRNTSLLDRVTTWGIDRKFVWQFLDDTAATSDHVGINYYGRFYVKTSGPGKFQVVSHDANEPNEELSDLGWAADHEGLEKLLLRAAQRYKKPIYILENGIADRDDDDVRRRRFLLGQTHGMWRAIQAGADVRAFMYWSLTDNFEWAEGFGPRFGLVKVDYGNHFARTPRPSAELYARIARANAIGAEDWLAPTHHTA